MRTNPVNPVNRVNPFRLLAAGVVIATLTFSASAQQRDRSAIPEKYTWNLADIYPSDAAWRPLIRVAGPNDGSKLLTKSCDNNLVTAALLASVC